MKILTTCVLAILLLLYIPRAVGLEPQTSKFRTLSEAVDFIVKRVEARQPAPFLDMYVLEYLAPILAHKSLADMYAGREFPQDKTTFTLGGGHKELDHLSITFVKKKDWWYLSGTSFCR